MDRETIREHLATAERHVWHGANVLRRQQHVVAELTRAGRSTEEAERLLRTIEESQRLHLIERDVIRAEFEGVE